MIIYYLYYIFNLLNIWQELLDIIYSKGEFGVIKNHPKLIEWLNVHLFLVFSDNERI